MDYYWLFTYGWGYAASVEALFNAMWKGEEWVQFYQQLTNFDAKFGGDLEKVW